MKLSVLALFLFLVVGAPAHVVAQESASPTIDQLSNEIQGGLMCLCGCNSVMKACPHVDCGFAVPARNQIRSMLEGGKTKTEIVDFMVEKHGEQILAAPKKEGFNLVGYIAPFIAIFVVGFLIVQTVKRWASRAGSAKPSSAKEAKPVTASNDNDELVDKMKKELEEFDD
ncbi:hypothetical protein MNBD_NITROSPINAE01-576 [hydrothermal vent metagenome]|uniref:CcmH/CycL/Ccl2/NrfF N-terminal domain-containing protein n=1 Tax=hydrothermal vent metagenome TaxID=652676 RepID=A0A3B1BW74_9ZZZZ